MSICVACPQSPQEVKGEKTRQGGERDGGGGQGGAEILEWRIVGKETNGGKSKEQGEGKKGEP